MNGRISSNNSWDHNVDLAPA